MAWSSEAWLPARLNSGWTYHDRVDAASAQKASSVAGFYASRYPHTSLEGWNGRLARGEISRNGEALRGDGPLRPGDHLAWQRPAWREEAVPAAWSVVHDDGDLLVIDKPAGLPVLPAGGWLEHTALRLLERRHHLDPGGVPRPVHRLGRFTSGLLVCARQGATRRWLSARLRESTARLEGEAVCQKVYQAVLAPGGLPSGMAPGESLTIRTPIGRRPHPRLGLIWCAADGDQPGDLPARSVLTLVQGGPESLRVEVAIASGRPHQIRIHCAAIGAPLLGDPLYLPGGLARHEALPGQGGYELRAQRLALARPDGSWARWEADRPGREPLLAAMPG